MRIKTNKNDQSANKEKNLTRFQIVRISKTKSDKSANKKHNLLMFHFVRISTNNSDKSANKKKLNLTIFEIFDDHFYKKRQKLRMPYQ